MPLVLTCDTIWLCMLLRHMAMRSHVEIPHHFFSKGRCIEHGAAHQQASAEMRRHVQAHV